ncbi:hypothetical protein J2M54_02530 [Arthrobacter sp. zg-ZUI227]|nr:hypothetical protein [Arthrobacter jiangjiafuii]
MLEERVGQEQPAHVPPQSQSDERNNPFASTIDELAVEIGVPISDVLHAAVQEGLPRSEARPSLALYASEVDILLGFFAERWKWRQDHPIEYQPSADGRISFETYERIRLSERERLERGGFLPSRKLISRQPLRAWPQILRHQTHAKKQVTSAALAGKVTQIPPTVSPLSTSRMARAAVSPSKQPPANQIRVTSSTTPPKKLQAAAATNTALIPPKPASVLQLQNRQVVGLINKEVEGGQHTGVSPEPAFRTYRTTVSAGSAAVADLQETLREFHPRMYATFFDQFRDVLDVDRLVSRTMRTGRGFFATDPEHVRIINDVCEYSYGIFAYWEMGSKIGRKARSLPPPSTNKVKSALMNLRPMYKGVLTDLCHRRFVFWRVGKIWDLLEVRFDDVHDWLEGLAAGEYVPLTTHHIPLGNYPNLATCANLSNRDHDIVKFMSEAAQNLRQGVRGVRGRKATNGGAALQSRTSGASASSGPRTLGYRPENTWLVPITITDGHVDTTLDEDFFTSPDDKKPHQVRSFYRRPKGSSPSAPRTEFVSGHVRGGRGAFADMKLLPTVTIRRR